MEQYHDRSLSFRGSYKDQSLHFNIIVYLNNNSTSFFRADGETQATFGLEEFKEIMGLFLEQVEIEIEGIEGESLVISQKCGNGMPVAKLKQILARKEREKSISELFGYFLESEVKLGKSDLKFKGFWGLVPLYDLIEGESKFSIFKYIFSKIYSFLANSC